MLGGGLKQSGPDSKLQGQTGLQVTVDNEPMTYGDKLKQKLPTINTLQNLQSPISVSFFRETY